MTIEQFRETLNSYYSQRDDLKAQLEEAKENAIKLTEAYENALLEGESLKSCEDAKDGNSSLIRRLNERITTLEGVIERKKKELAVEVLNGWTDAFNDLEKQAKVLRDKMAPIKKEKANLEAQASDLWKSFNDLRVQYDNFANQTGNNRLFREIAPTQFVVFND